MDFFDKITKKATQTYQYTAEKTNKFAKEAKLKTSMNHHKDEIEDLYIEIGKRVYEHHIRENDQYVAKEIEDLCSQIDQIAKIIEEERNELLTLKDLKKCYQCDTQIELSFRYCPTCGADQKNIQLKNENLHEPIIVEEGDIPQDFVEDEEIEEE